MRSLYLFIVLFVVISMSFGQDAKTWKILYSQAKTIKEKRDKVIKMAEVANAEFNNLVFDILQEEVEYALEQDVQEKKYFDEWVINTVNLATKLKVPNIASQLKALYQKIDTPRLKGDLMVSMGKTLDKSLLDFINNELRVFNELQKAGGIKGKEDIVDGVVKALDSFKDSSSFSYLFYASLYNYSEKTRKLAKSALDKITDNPASYCDEIIINETDMNVVFEALKFSYSSKSPDVEKINSARFALQIGLDTMVSSEKNTARVIQDEIRDEATLYLGNLKAKDKDIITLIDKKWRMDKGANSNLVSIEALQKISTTDSAKLLSDRLGELNAKVKDGSGTGFGKDEGEKITLAIIRALGAIADPVATDELLKVKNSTQYANTIKQEAVKALEKINKK